MAETMTTQRRKRRQGGLGIPGASAGAGEPIETAGEAAEPMACPESDGSVQPARGAGGKRRNPLIPIPPDQELLEVRQVAHMLNCSVRNIWRKSDAGKMPGPISFDGKTFWSRRTLRDWIADGCHPIR